MCSSSSIKMKTSLRLPDKIGIFDLVKIDYSKALKENFIALD
jgi:hypothetical protein